jgi:drug/metabolite transporter (DMT)-like permease
MRGRIISMNKKNLYPMLQALLAALLFGASAPIAKVLLGDVQPIPLAGLLYLGSGISLLALKAYQRLVQKSRETEAGITRPDIKWLVGAILTGGIAAPIVLLFSLQETPAATASLLLNFEGVATMLIAALIFKEGIGRRAGWAILLITLASVVLSTNPNQEWGLSIGALGILTACLLWGLDNNLTCNISAKDPLIIVTVKGLAAGSFSLLLGAAVGNQFPSFNIVLKAMLLGSLSYGASIVLFVHALRGLGAARTSALFGTAPLAGVVLSFIIFRENFNFMLLTAIPLMIVGAFLLINEEHIHNHIHNEISHEYSHQHDDSHHTHEHIEGLHFDQPHSHLHIHPSAEHGHHHMPDLHHRHLHGAEE